MKVVMLTKYPLDEMRGGPKMHRERLIACVAQMKEVELHIVTFGSENKNFKKGNLNIHEVRKIKAFYFPFFALSMLLAMKRKIKEINPDIVHALGTFIPCSTIAAFVRNKYPVVVTLYGVASEELIKSWSDVSYFYALFSTLYQKYIIKNMDIIVPSLSIKNLISKNTNHRTYVVPYGIEFEKIQKMQSYNLHNIEKPDVFLVAVLRKVKGIDILINSIPAVIKSIPDLTVYIAGSGNQENELKNIVKKLKLGKYVKFLGFISEEEKYQYYKTSKIIVIPSRWDVLPITLYEAMVSGKPVISSNVGGIPDLIDDGKTGFLFESENEVDLAEKIVKLLKDEKLRDEMGKRAKEKAKQYEWRKIVKRTVKIYKEVIADFHERKVKIKKNREYL